VAEHVGAVRVGKLDGDFVVNPEEETLQQLDLDLIVSGTQEAILMVEAERQWRSPRRRSSTPRHRPL